MSWGDGVPSYSDELTTELAKALRAKEKAERERDEAREQVRSLTVERYAARTILEQATRRTEGKLGDEVDDLRARLSKAREALDTVSCALDAARALLPPIVETRDYVAADQALDDALAALRAALAEPPGGP